MRYARFRKIAVSAIALLGFVSVIITFSGLAKVQRKAKRAVSMIYFHPKSVTPPVEYSLLKIRGKQTRLSSMFEEGNEQLQKSLGPEEELEEDDDFWEHLSFDVTNVSDKTIVFIRTYVFMYTEEGIRSRRRQSAASIDFGNPLTPYTASLRPGESVTLTLDPMMVDHVRQKVQQLNSPIIRIGIFAESVHYEDGYRWSFDGKVVPPQSGQKQSSLRKQSATENKISSIITGRRTREDFAAKAGSNIFSVNPAGFVVFNKHPADFSIFSIKTWAAQSPPCGQQCNVRNGEEAVGCKDEPNTTCKVNKAKWRAIENNETQESYGIMGGLPIRCYRPGEVESCADVRTHLIK